jgi:hypothetical protein
VLGSNNRHLAECLEKEFLIPREKGERVLAYVAEYCLYCLTFKGAVDSPLGKLSLEKTGIQIVEQNTALLNALGGQQSRDSIMQQIREIISGGAG